MLISIYQDQLFKASSYFINLNNTDISFVDQTKKDAKFEDSLLKIDCVPIFPNQSTKQCSSSVEILKTEEPKEDSYVENLPEETQERKLFI